MRLTASRIALARRCAWWARPEVDVPAQEASAAAAVGTALHAVAEKEAEDVDEQAVEKGFGSMVSSAVTGKEFFVGAMNASSVALLEQLVAAWRAWWPEFSKGFTSVGCEMPYAIDVDTGDARSLKNWNRDYSEARPREVPGTVDVIAVDAGGELVVVDYKTGRNPHKYRDHEEQMRDLGTAVARACGAKKVRVVVAHVTPDGVLVDQRELDEFDFAVVLEELRELVDGIPEAIARPGLHCEDDWCPAKAVCPVTRALLLEAKVPLDERRRLPLVGPIRSNEEAFATLVAIPLLEELLEERKRAVKAYADAVPVRAPDGRVYRPRTVKRESPKLEVAGAENALVEVLGPEHAKEAIQVKRSTTWTAIKKVAREHGLKATDIEEQAREAFRAANALKVSEFTSYEWKAEKQ